MLNLEHISFQSNESHHLTLSKSLNILPGLGVNTVIQYKNLLAIYQVAWRSREKTRTICSVNSSFTLLDYQCFFRQISILNVLICWVMHLLHRNLLSYILMLLTCPNLVLSENNMNDFLLLERTNTKAKALIAFCPQLYLNCCAFFLNLNFI